MKRNIWKKLTNESIEKVTIQIRTGLKGKKSVDILNSVIGQLSDGMWENSPIMEHYWPYVDAILVGNEAILEVYNHSYKRGYDAINFFLNKFNMDDDKIKYFFADKIKAIIKQELKDGLTGGWNRDNIEESEYVSYEIPITVQEAYLAYEVLKGRNCLKKYPDEIVQEMIG